MEKARGEGHDPLTDLRIRLNKKCNAEKGKEGAAQTTSLCPAPQGPIVDDGGVQNRVAGTATQSGDRGVRPAMQTRKEGNEGNSSSMPSLETINESEIKSMTTSTRLKEWL
ncbi:hypothetical protein Salat_2916200 [Sesamum alatum]|uniref:Uncharacterized protein n=1 Tax=Sesamum alatum TaxID=300844 RepID=A0AAE1XIY3_9LAMI|nr:hypothetical protein Salat_2916200 [Sesamum alatum]